MYIVVIILSLSSVCFSIDVEKWGMYEFSATGPSEKTSGLNPFVDVTFGAVFKHTNSTAAEINVNGFYDGDGKYRVRFMPGEEGVWSFITQSNQEDLDGLTGDFNCVGVMSPLNKGQAKVYGDHSFRWEDGDPYFSVGTTAYSWVHHAKWADATLKTLADRNQTFNKIRYCVFPLNYVYTHGDPPFWPYEGTPPKSWQYDRFHVPFWQNFEKRIQQVQDLGYITDLILFDHNEDWGFDNMEEKYDRLYLRYVMARFGAFRSIWWSMANEFDRVQKSMSEWQNLFKIMMDEDPYQHERSIHNSQKFYNYNDSSITHISLQLSQVESSSENDWRYLKDIKKNYVHKPWVIDECRYEGDLPHIWGNLSPQSMTKMFWLFATNLAQAGHSETYYKKIDNEEVLWWTKGNVLRGTSPPRIHFYRDFMDDIPVKWEDLETQDLGKDRFGLTNMGTSKKYYLFFWSGKDSSHHNFHLGNDYAEYDLYHVDYWNMQKSHLSTVKPGDNTYNPSKVPFLLEVRGKGARVER